MADPTRFQDEFDEHGLFKRQNGTIRVVFLTQGGSRYAGSMEFKNGLLTAAQMDGFSSWQNPDGSPLGGLRFLILTSTLEPLAVYFDQGKLVLAKPARETTSKKEFLANVRLGRNLFFHGGVTIDPLSLDANNVSERMTRGALWLTPKAVHGFSESDFQELPSDTLSTLKAAVEAFRKIAFDVPPTDAPSKDHFVQAAREYLTILKTLEPYLPVRDEAQAIESALSSLDYPDWVVNWDYEFGSDKEGEPALWVNIFADNSLPRTSYASKAMQFFPKIRDTLAALGVRRWPYVKISAQPEFKQA